MRETGRAVPRARRRRRRRGQRGVGRDARLVRAPPPAHVEGEHGGVASRPPRPQVREARHPARRDLRASGPATSSVTSTSTATAPTTHPSTTFSGHSAREHRTMPVRAVILDFYGTLAETRDWGPSWEELVAELGYELPDDVRRPLVERRHRRHRARRAFAVARSLRRLAAGARARDARRVRRPRCRPGRLDRACARDQRPSAHHRVRRGRTGARRPSRARAHARDLLQLGLGPGRGRRRRRARPAPST